MVCIWSVDVLEVLMFSGLPGIYGAVHLIRWDMDLWVVVVDILHMSGFLQQHELPFGD